MGMGIAKILNAVGDEVAQPSPPVATRRTSEAIGPAPLLQHHAGAGLATEPRGRRQPCRVAEMGHDGGSMQPSVDRAQPSPACCHAPRYGG